MDDCLLNASSQNLSWQFLVENSVFYLCCAFLGVEIEHCGVKNTETKSTDVLAYPNIQFLSFHIQMNVRAMIIENY